MLDSLRGARILLPSTAACECCRVVSRGSSANAELLRANDVLPFGQLSWTRNANAGSIYLPIARRITLAKI